MDTIIPYGSWLSPISSDLLSQQSVRLSEPQLADGFCYWLESRPSEQGRSALMRKPLKTKAGDKKSTEEVLPPNISVRSKAHEYGGASYCVDGESLYFIEAEDQRIYHWNTAEIETTIPTPITPEGPYRYADLTVDHVRQRLLCVREDHSDATREETSELIAIDPHGDRRAISLISGHDFFSNPQVSPNGRQLSWLCWDHPNMPWDSSECWLADIDINGQATSAQRVAGGPGESIFQPQWGPDNQLYLVSDRNDWWNIYRLDTDNQILQPVTQLAAEFATPQWVFGMSTYGFLSDTEVLACFTRQGQWQLTLIDLPSAELTLIDTPYCDISQIQVNAGCAAFLAASHTSSSQLLAFDGQHFQKLANSSDVELPENIISRPQPITFETGRDAQAHGFYYPPCNANICGPQNKQPPLIVLCHGGPTGATDTGLNLKVQYWTSRGFAVMDVNYRGSTGYGRHYREQLNVSWGVHDVEDVCAAAHYLVERGLANAEQLTIKGSSAGGYTVLAALTFTDTFKAGASLYGIGDLESLATDTHKFESRYLDSLVGAYPAEQTLYQQRSPIHHAEQLNCPVIFFQGLEDKVVPPAQAETMVAALDAKKVPVAYLPFTGEGHGFRQASSIERCLEAELSFYSQVFGFDLPTITEALPIRNLTAHTSQKR